MFKSILVLESPWDKSSVHSKSVWPFVSEFARATDLQACHQSFSDTASFRHWVKRFSRARDIKSPRLLYVAAHGTDGRISGLRKSINGKTVTDALRSAKGISYVHFGSCLYGSDENLTRLLKKAKHLHWAAGYDRAIDWVESTVFDVMLWSRIAFRDRETKGQKSHTVVKSLLAQMPQFAEGLGFRLQYRYGRTIGSATAGGEE